MTSQNASPPPRASYRHIVFADASSLAGRPPLNFGPAVSSSRRGVEGTLRADEQIFVAWLLEKANLSINDYRPETLGRRLSACLRFVRTASVHEARAVIEANPSLLWPAVGSLVIGVTSFFRDAGVFSTLEKMVLPSLLDSGRSIRIWSVGCSDGQEIYSIAMLLSQMRKLHRVQLLGTDCRVDAVRRGAEGIYGDADVRSVPAEMLGYFSRVEQGWIIEPRMRAAIQWRTANVLRIPEPGQWDVILCRNCAMYMEPEAASLLWKRLYAVLRPGGVLVVGKAERPDLDHLHPIAPHVFRRMHA